MKLFNNNTGAMVLKGDTVVSFRGEKATVTGWREPQHAGSTGRVFVREEGIYEESSYFPSVYNLEFR